MANFLITRYFFGKFQEIFPLRENGAKVENNGLKSLSHLVLAANAIGSNFAPNTIHNDFTGITDKCHSPSCRRKVVPHTRLHHHRQLCKLRSSDSKNHNKTHPN
jgi:hypothetical protein